MKLRWFRTRSAPIATQTLLAFIASTLSPVYAATLNAERAVPNVAVSEQRAEEPPQAPPPELSAGVAADRQSVTDTAKKEDPQGSLRAHPEALPTHDFGGTPSEVNVLDAPSGASAPNIGAQSTSLPGGAGTALGMGESFSTQLSTGGAVYSIPIMMPAARGPAQPVLSLAYSSAGGYGVAGVGWSIGAGGIVRQTDRGIPRYDDRADWHPEQDRFTLSGLELVPICTVSPSGCTGAASGEVMPAWAQGWQYFRPRIEGSFQRVFWSPDHRTWRVQAKSGVQVELGVPLDGSGYTGALETDPGNPNVIYGWMVVRQYDSRGLVNGSGQPQPLNLVQYRYMTHGQTVYLSDIYDTPPAATPNDPLANYAHHTRLVYEARADILESYRSGWGMQQGLRLKRIDITSHTFDESVTSPRELLRRYQLGYDATSHASLLTSVRMEGRCALRENAAGDVPTTPCPSLPALEFEYERVTGAASSKLKDSLGFDFEAFNEQVRTLENSPPHSLDESLAGLIDVNSDGLPDLVATAPALYSGSHGLFLNGLAQGSTTNRGFANAASMPVLGLGGVDANVLKFSNPNVSVSDTDGDGRVDLVHMPHVKTYDVWSSVPNGSGWAWSGRSITNSSQQDAKIDFSKDARRVKQMDVNGDGLVDFVFSGATELQTFFALGRYASGDGQFGQGIRNGGSATISNEPARTCLPWSAVAVRFDDPDVQIADFNGDGLPDIARVRAGQFMYWPGRGNGYFGTGDRATCLAGSFGQDRHVLMQNSPQFGPVGSGSLLLNDVNGDGLADMVEIRAEAVDVYLNDRGRSWTARYTIRNTPFKSNASKYVRLTDINGSATPDILWGKGREYRYIDLAGGVRPHVLRRAHNGIGRTLELEYSTSTEQMLAARAAGVPWTTTAPTVVPVVVRSTILDNLDRIGRPLGRYVTEYSYRDPVYEGRQREFRGFRSAEVRSLGDANSPTAIERSTFLLGECVAPPSNPTFCNPSSRWRDNPREALKGLTVLVEKLNQSNVYLTSAHNTYELREMYLGRDSRRVVAAFASGTDVYTYDTASFAAAATNVSIPEVEVKLSDLTQTENATVVRRATTGTVRTRTRTTFDTFGNPTDNVAFGCTEGCTPVDETITTHSDFDRPLGEGSGWLWLETASYVTGSVHTERRREITRVYDVQGNLMEERANLRGTLALDRSHASGGTVAPGPTNASGGITAPVVITSSLRTQDSFGNVTKIQMPGSRCKQFVFDSQYAQLPVTEILFAGSPGSDGCGTTQLLTRHTYNRGFALALTSTDPTGQPVSLERDEFGRVIRRTDPDPDRPGFLAPQPTETVTYDLPTDWRTRPYLRIKTTTLDGATLSVASVREHHVYSDGLGRTLVSLDQADPSAGDGGAWIAGGTATYDAKGGVSRRYQPWFSNASPTAFPLAQTPPSASATEEFDAFARTTRVLGFDGSVQASTRYHALSTDLYDPEDLRVGGPRFDTFTTTTRDGHGRTVRGTSRIHIDATTIELRHVITEFLATGEIERVIQRRGTTTTSDVVRWFRYDSLGRRVLNVEPNSSTGFNPSPATDPAAIKAWRYAYNDAGDLVGTSDPRGCGTNYFFDTAGRPTGEDFSPCLSHQAAYSAPNFTNGSGLEVWKRYDTADPEAPVDAAGRALGVVASLLPGRLVSISDRGAKTIFRYDALGRVTGKGVRVVKPGTPDNSPSTRYAPRWYVQTQLFNAGSQLREVSTGSSVAELLGTGSQSLITPHYSKRGMVDRVDSSYGTLVSAKTYAADGLVTSSTLGDAAATQRAYDYDGLRRLSEVQAFRATPGIWSATGYPPLNGAQTQQLSLEDLVFEYDLAHNITKISDFRPAADWPNNAKPVTRVFSYDDLYRLTRVDYQMPAGGDVWQSPYNAENTGTPQPKPSPHVSFTTRVKNQTYAYDALANVSSSGDDTNGFYDRSYGTATFGTTTAGPNQLKTASNRPTNATRRGDLAAAYDQAGNLTDLIIKREGSCLPTGASCWQRFNYRWDEVGQLTSARRWDLTTTPAERTTNGTLTSPLPTRTPNVELRYAYDEARVRVLKTAVNSSNAQVHTAYIFPSLELRRATFTTDYLLDRTTETVRLSAGSTAIGRVIYAQQSVPTLTSGRQHVLLEFKDHLASNSFVIDRETGELVEYVTYQGYGGTESDYRPTRWASFREEQRTSGKEDDIEVGLTYFGHRYYAPGLHRWINPDPATIHQLGSDLNPYSFVDGRPTIAVESDGRVWQFLLLMFIIGVAVSATTQWANGANMSDPGVWIRAGVAGLAMAAGAYTGGATYTWAIGEGASPVVASFVGGMAGGYFSYNTSVAVTYVPGFPGGPAQYSNTDALISAGVAGVMSAAGTLYVSRAGGGGGVAPVAQSGTPPAPAQPGPPPVEVISARSSLPALGPAGAKTTAEAEVTGAVQQSLAKNAQAAQASQAAAKAAKPSTALTVPEGRGGWPPEDGFLLGQRHFQLKPPTGYVQRMGSTNGEYLQPGGADVRASATPTNYPATKEFTLYRVNSNFPHEAGMAEPWFPQKGGPVRLDIQLKLNFPTQTLIDDGTLTPIFKFPAGVME